MMSKLPQVAVIIPTWNKKDYCLRCISSVYQLHYPQGKITIWVVDNGSNDGTTKALGRQFPKVNILPLDKNVGFGAAVNKGISFSRGKYILILDNDVLLHRNVLKALVGVAEKNSDFGVLSGKLYDGFAGRRIQTFFGDIDPTTFQVTRIGAGQEDRGQFDKLMVVDYVPLGAALVRRSIFKKVGYLDENYFVYFEDTDFLFRCKMSGIKVVFVPEAIIWHKGSVSLGRKSPKIIYYLSRNNLIIRRKFRGVSFWSHLENIKLFLNVGLGMMFFKQRRRMYKGAMMGIYDFYRGRFGEAPGI